MHRQAQATLRPVAAHDWPFLEALYASTRQQELRAVAWDETQKQAFLRMQFEAQSRHYATHYASASTRVIEHGGAPVGRLMLDRRSEEIRIVDISLLPGHRGLGLGTALVREVQAEAGRSGRCVRIHVERQNPARRLYLRLGFSDIEDAGVYCLMEWRPRPGDDQTCSEH